MSETLRVPEADRDYQIQDAVDQFKAILAQVQGVEVQISAEPLLLEWSHFELCHQGSWCYPDGLPFFRLWRSEIGYLAECAHLGQFFIERTGTSVRLWHDAQTPLPIFADYFLNTILAIVLELQGVLCLHASSITIGGQTFAFLGDAGVGKSTLAAEFVADGATLLADDITPIMLQDGGYVVLPMGAKLKLRSHVAASKFPSEALTSTYVADVNKHWLRIGKGWGHWSPQVQRLSALYILERQEDESPEVEKIKSESLSGQASILALIRNSYLASLISPLGLHQSWLSRLAQVANTIPIRRLRYSSGLHQLAQVREAIVATEERFS